MKTIYVCSTCKGQNIQIKSWIDPNTHEYKEDAIFDHEDTWCADCQEGHSIEPENSHSDELPDSGKFLSDSWLDKADEKYEAERDERFDRLKDKNGKITGD